MNKIINFHRINNNVWFEKVIFYLKSKYRFISTKELYEYFQGKTILKDACHITIDDGDKSFYNNIFPVLKKHQVFASIYVSPKIITEEINFWFQEIDGYNQLELKKIISDMYNIPMKDLMKFNIESILKTLQLNEINEIINRYKKITNIPKKSPLNMTLDNLKVVYRSGLISIGAHTLNHPILMNENDSLSKSEIKESIFELSNILNHEIKYFAYPNGISNLDFSEREKIYLKEANIRLSFSTDQRNFSASNDIMSIPRFGVSNNESIPYFKSKIYMGSLWNQISIMKPGGEFQQRKKIKSLFKSFDA